MQREQPEPLVPAQQVQPALSDQTAPLVLPVQPERLELVPQELRVLMALPAP